MTSTELKAWTFELAVRAIGFTKPLLGTAVIREPLLRQLLRSATAIPAHYRSACRAQSRRDFIMKMKRLEEEADESMLWLELLRATGLPAVQERESKALESECDQLVSIAVQSAKTARRNLRNGREPK